MDGNTVLKRSADVAFEIIDGEATLVKSSDGSYYSMNPVGTEFWQLLDGRRTLDEHARVIADTYDAELTRVTADLLNLAAALRDYQVVEIV